MTEAPNAQVKITKTTKKKSENENYLKWFNFADV